MLFGSNFHYLRLALKHHQKTSCEMFVARGFIYLMNIYCSSPTGLTIEKPTFTK